MAASSGNLDQLVAGHLALLDQIHHGQKTVPILDQEPGQFLLVDFPLLADGAVSFLHGGSGSPFKRLATRFLQNRANRRSTFTFGLVLLDMMPARLITLD
jgi:hypothetical protein